MSDPEYKANKWRVTVRERCKDEWKMARSDWDEDERYLWDKLELAMGWVESEFKTTEYMLNPTYSKEGFIIWEIIRLKHAFGFDDQEIEEATVEFPIGAAAGWMDAIIKAERESEFF